MIQTKDPSFFVSRFVSCPYIYYVVMEVHLRDQQHGGCYFCYQWMHCMYRSRNVAAVHIQCIESRSPE